MSSNVPQSGHGASPFTGPNQVLVSNSLNGERTVFDLNSVPVGSLLGRTATGIGVYPTVGGGGPTALSLDDLTDVRTTSPEPTIGQVLTYDGTEWVPDDPAGGASTFPDGTVSAPSITFTSDTNTGFFRPAADTIGATVGGTSALLVDNLGKVAIGINATAGDSSVAIGNGSSAPGNGGIVIGEFSQVNNPNIIIGSSSGSLSLGSHVIGIGSGVLTGTMTNSPANIVAIGDEALKSNLNPGVGGNCNSVAVGASALAFMTTGTDNVGIGNQGGIGVVGGSFNTCVGGFTGFFIGNGSGNTCVGNSSSITSAASNGVAVGSNATADADGVAVGSSAISTGTGTIVIGRSTGRGSLGANNIAIGTGALSLGTTAVTECVAVGHTALDGAMTGTAQTATAVGFGALGGVTSATGCTAVGHIAGRDITTGANQTVIGSNARGSIASAGNTIIGQNAGHTPLGANNVAVGLNALDQASVAVAECVAVGANAMGGVLITTTAQTTTAVGFNALVSQTNASGNTAVGHSAGQAITTGSNQTVVGAGARGSILGAGNTIVGQNAGSTILGANNVAMGLGALDGAVTAAAAECVAVGANALGGAVNQAAPTTVAVGFNALVAQTTATGNTAVGHGAGLAVNVGISNTLLGRTAGSTITSGTGNTCVGAGTVCAAGLSDNVVVGLNATSSTAGAVVVGTSANASATNGIAIGLSSVASGITGIAVGQAAVAAGSDNISIGRLAGSSTLGANCIAIGNGALDGTHTLLPSGAVAIGVGAMSANMGVAANTSVAVGTGALAVMTNGTGNTGIGSTAGNAITTGVNNTFLGAATNGSALLNSQTCLGAGTTTTAAGAIAIGRNSAGTSAVGAVADGLAFPTTLATVAAGLAVQFNGGAMGPLTSSIRYKKDVTLAPLSADAPATLKPIDLIRVVEFDSKVDGDDRRHLGMIAEEVVDLLHPSLVPRDTEGNPVGISYDRVVCLCIQEIQLLRRRVATLEGAPLPALPEYTPVRARDLYDADQIDDELQALQKQQYKARSRQLRIDRIVERIEKDPLKETAILNKLNKTTRDAVLKAMEDKATAEAQREAALAEAGAARFEEEALAEAARLAAEAQAAAAEQQARDEAEAARVAAEEAAAQAEAERLLAAKEARLDALARKKMAANVDLETVGPKMKARIEALIEKDRLALEASEAARLEAEEVARLAQIAAEEEERRLEEEAENDE
jgi:hypothetical protein